MSTITVKRAGGATVTIDAPSGTALCDALSQAGVEVGAGDSVSVDGERVANTESYRLADGNSLVIISRDSKSNG